MCLGFRARVQGEGLVHGVWNKGSEDLENQFGGLLWSSEKRYNARFHIYILDQSWGGIPFQASCFGGFGQGFREKVQSMGLE